MLGELGLVLRLLGAFLYNQRKQTLLVLVDVELETATARDICFQVEPKQVAVSQFLQLMIILGIEVAIF